MPAIQMIYRYPVKSFPGEEMDSVSLNNGEGIKDDRRYAITNGISNTMDGAWLTCRSFFINAVNDGLLKYANESDEETVTLAAPNGTRISWRRDDAESLAFANRRLSEFIAPLLPAHDLPPPLITERRRTPGQLSGYWDFNDSGISFMNLASLEAVATAIGKPLDARRLRGNFYVDDLTPWEEFAWLGKRIRIGQNGPELEILRPIRRCPATAVNPQTGERDIKVADAINDHFGHAFCGMYAKVVKPGSAARGDGIHIIGDAKIAHADAANPADTPPALWPKMVEVVDVSPTSPSGEGSNGKHLTIRATSPWPLPEATPGQRFRFHIAQDLIGVATVQEQRDHTTVLHVEPSQTRDPATAYLLDKVQTGDQFIVSGPFGRG